MRRSHPSGVELLDAVQELLASEIEAPDPVSGSAIERIRRNIRSYRQIALRHPRAFMLLAARRFNTPRAFDIYEQMLMMYADCGLAPREQAYWFRLLGGFVNGAGMAYVASIEHIPAPTKLQRAPQAIPLPHVSTAAPFLRIEGLEAAFEFGLDVLLGVLARREGTAQKRQALTTFANVISTSLARSCTARADKACM